MVVSLSIGRSPVWAVDASTFLPVLLLVLTFVVGAVVIALVQRWRRRAPAPGPSVSDQLAQYRSLYEQGVLSEEEYRKLRATLTGELRRAVDLPVPARQPPPPANDQPPPPGN